MQNKNSLIQRVKEETDLPLNTVGRVVNSFLYELNHALLRREKVRINQVGIFKVMIRQPRIARNPKTGKKVQVPTRLVVKFRGSASVRRLLNEKRSDNEGRDTKAD